MGVFYNPPDYCALTDEEGHNNPTTEELNNLSAGAVEEYTYEIIKKYLALDDYGISAVESLIASEYNRCRVQGSLRDASGFSIEVSFHKIKSL